MDMSSENKILDNNSLESNIKEETVDSDNINHISSAGSSNGFGENNSSAIINDTESFIMDMASENGFLDNDHNSLESNIMEEIGIEIAGIDRNCNNNHIRRLSNVSSGTFGEFNINDIELLTNNNEDNRKKEVAIPAQKSSSIPHNGKLIKKIICSPNLKYIVTFSEDDNSIVGWLVDDENLENGERLKPEISYNFDEFQQDEALNVTCIETISDQKFIVFGSNPEKSDLKNKYYLLYLFNKKFIKLLNNQKKPFNYECPTFLTNGDLFVISYENDIIYLFSLDPNKPISELTCKAAYNIGLPKSTASGVNVAKYFTIIDSYLLINNGNKMTSQWDLTNMAFDLQYFSEISLPNSCYAIFNKYKTLLAVYLYVEKQLIIYSIPYGIKLTTFTFKKEKCDDMVFIYTKDNTEHLFVILQDKHGIVTNYILMDPYNLDNFANISEIYTEYLFKDESLTKKHKQKFTKDKIIILDNNFIVLQKIMPEKIILPNSHLKNFNHLFSTPVIMKSACERVDNLLSDNINITNYFPNEFKLKSNSNQIRWTIDYDKESGYLKLKLFEVGNLIIIGEYEYDYFEKCTHFLLNCEVLENGDLLLITRLSIMIFSLNLNGKKIYLKYFWNDPIEQEKYWVGHIGHNHIEEIKERTSKSLAKFKDLNELPSLNYNYIFDNYNQSYIGKDNTSRQPFKDMILAILEDISLFTMFADKILESALKNNKGSIVELVCDKCLFFLQQNPEMNIGLTIFLVNELPKLSKHYPGIVKKFLEQTSMLLDPSCDKIFVSNLPSHYGCCYDIDLYKDNTFWNLYFLFQSNYHKPMETVKKYFDDHSIFTGKFSLNLVVPLPKFASYPNDYSFWKELFYRPESNNFIKMDNKVLFKMWNGEALLDFKWHKFALKYYLGIWLYFIIFFISFSFITSLRGEIDKTTRNTFLSISCILGFTHLLIEIKRFMWNPKHYFFDFWNYFDLGSYLFPIITSLFWIINDNVPTWMLSLSNLLLDLKFMLFLRVFKYFGKYFAIIIGVAKKVFSFLVILFIIVFSFAHALFIQLRPKEGYSLDIPEINSDQNNPWNIVSKYFQIFENGTYSNKPILIQQPEISTNMFAEFSTSMLAIYKFLTGDNSALSSISYEQDVYLILLMVTFSFLIVIYLLNLFIGLLSNAIEKNNTREAFLAQKAKIIYEIELFYLLPHQRRWQTWFPDLIYYNVPVKEIRQKIQSINMDKIKKKKEYPPIISKKLRELVGIPTVDKIDLSIQFEKVKNDLDILKKNYAELQNQFGELKKELHDNSESIIYKMKESDAYIIETISDLIANSNKNIISPE